MPSVAPVVVAALIVRDVPAEELYALIPLPEVPVVVPVVVMLSAPEPIVISINAIGPARRGGRVNREDVPAEELYA